MKRTILAVVAALIVVAVTHGQALAAKVALVIGNGAYKNTAPLPNPPSDARAFSAFLTKAGFSVTFAGDATRAEMSAALTKFGRALKPEDTAVFYYAGHGMQMAGENYLVGVEAQLASEFDVPGETLGLSTIIELLESRANVSMIFIDACRNNPLAQNLAKESTRAITNGLAPVQVKGDGTMIAFAANPGQVAYDGLGGNSPFTKALVQHLGTPGLEVGTAFKRVIGDVRRDTEDRQSPQIVSSLSTEFYFGGEVAASPGTVPATTPAAPPVDIAELDFAKAERLNSPRAWQLFIEKHPNGFFTDLAIAALELLTGQTAADASLSPQEAEQRLELTPAQRKEVQVALNGLGYKLGTPDGVLGNNSRRQIARYQAAAGLQETGFISSPMLIKLGIPVPGADAVVFSGDEAVRYNVADVEGLESDPRLLNALGCLKQRELKYGFYNDHVYIAVLTYGMNFEKSHAEAQRCGGNLASIASQEENDFIFDLFKLDDRFLSISPNDWNDQVAFGGPLIGLRQVEGAREPRGGWEWVDGSPLSFTAWEEGEPSNTEGAEDIAIFWAHNQRMPGPNDPIFPARMGWNDGGGGANGYIMEIQ